MQRQGNYKVPEDASDLPGLEVSGIVVEKKGSSVIPVAFWWCSFVGGIITLIYAVHIRSFPFVLAQGIGIIVYSRNLILIYKNKKFS